MSDEYSVSVSLPLDSDGFLRRQCPSCERQFKWFSHPEGDPDAEVVEQYFCPLCGQPGGTDSWWTNQQVAFFQGAAAPELERMLQESVGEALSGLKGVSFKPNNDFSLDIPDDGPPSEPDDMIIVEPPCHPNEPVKVPETSLGQVHCLVCGSQFAT